MASRKQPQLNAETQQKLEKLKLKQDKWLQQREQSLKTSKAPSSSKPDKTKSGSSVTPSKSSSQTSASRSVASSSGKPSSQTRTSQKHSNDTLMWTGAKGSDSDFVLRKSSKTASKSPPHDSTRSTTDSFAPFSARSENFVNTVSAKGRPAASDNNNTSTPRDDDDNGVAYSNMSSISNTSTAIEGAQRIYDHTTYASQQIGHDKNHTTYASQQIGHDKPSRILDDNEQRKNKENEAVMQSHQCTLCKNTMIGDRHAPHIVFPCAHTFCCSCIAGEGFCPSCHVRIVSTQRNDTLAGVVAQYQKQRERDEMERKEREVRKYVSEYRSLCTRSDALKGEADSIISEMEGITDQLMQRKQNTKRIDDNTEDIKRQIAHLQEKLQAQTKEREEQADSSAALEAEYERSKEQLKLLEKTLKTILQSTDRIKMIIHEFSPTINLDDE